MLKCSMKIGVLIGCCLLLSTSLSPCLAAQGSPWLFRARLPAIFPDDRSSHITVVGGQAEVCEAFTPELDVSYFFTNNIAAGLIFFAYCRHDVKAKHTAVGDVDLAPRTLTLQYHFTPEKKFRPYMGAGPSYMPIPDEDPGAAAEVR